MVSYAYPDVLVETQWVADHLDDPNIRLIEAAYEAEKYDLEHIPGALPWTWNQDFQHPVRKDIPVEFYSTAEFFASSRRAMPRFRRCGAFSHATYSTSSTSLRLMC